MATCYLSPIGNEIQANVNGGPVNLGQIFTYLAGTSTPATTYTDDTGMTAQANPIILNSNGLSTSPIWLSGGVAYKFVFFDMNGVPYRNTIDDITGTNDPAFASTVDQWVLFPNVTTYVTGTSFSCVGDQTGIFQPFRRVKTVNTGGTIYSTIISAIFSVATTTVTLRNDAGVLDAGLSQVFYGLISPINTSLPQVPAFVATGSATATGGSTEATTYGASSLNDGSYFNLTTGRFTAPVAGLYRFDFQAQCNSGAGAAITGFLRINGVATNYGTAATSTSAAAGSVTNNYATGSAYLRLSAGDYVSSWKTVAGGLAAGISQFSGCLIA